MNLSKFAFTLLCAVVLSAPLAAQDAIQNPGEKTIGVGKPQIEPSLIVMNAAGATLAGFDSFLSCRPGTGSRRRPIPMRPARTPSRI